MSDNSIQELELQKNTDRNPGILTNFCQSRSNDFITKFRDFNVANCYVIFLLHCMVDFDSKQFANNVFFATNFWFESEIL